jgi:transposase
VKRLHGRRPHRPDSRRLDRQEELRALLATAKRGGHRHEIRDAKYWFLTWCAQFSKISEIITLAETVDTWWDEIEVFCRLNVTNARTEGSNRSIKSIKRVGCGSTNQENYQRRILAHAIAQTAA